MGRGQHGQMEGGNMNRDPLRINSGEGEMNAGMAGNHMISPGQEHVRAHQEELRHQENNRSPLRK